MVIHTHIYIYNYIIVYVYGKIIGRFSSQPNLIVGRYVYFFSRAKIHESNTYPKRLFEAYFEAFCHFGGEPYVVQYSSAVRAWFFYIYIYIAYFTPFVL